MKLILLLLSVCVYVNGFSPVRRVRNPVLSEGQNPEELQKGRELLERLKKVSRKRLMADNRQRSIAFNLDEEPISIPREAGSDEMSINTEEGVKDFLFQGDMLLREDQILAEISPASGRFKRNAMHNQAKWNASSIPYYLDNSLSAYTKDRITRVIRYIEQNTCIRFKEDDKATRPILKIFKGVGCWSYVGPSINKEIQELSFGNSCDMHSGILAHELFHALGFYHEQSRSDRDDYISLNLNNVKKDDQYLYDKENSQNSDNQDLPYEYGSIMHYGPAMLAIDRSTPVIYASQKLHQNTMGNRLRVTFQDMLEVNKLYGCEATCEKSRKKIACYNNGYPNPSDCSRCICPAGFGGKQCNELEKPTEGSKECGSAVLQANSSWTKLTGGVSTPAGAFDKIVLDPEVCWWKITAPAGQKVIIRVDSLFNYQCNDGCSFNNIEIKLGNFVQTGYRFCCEKAIVNEYFYSEDSTLLLGAFAKYGAIYFGVSYKIGTF